jgi:hypothetical protein
MEDARCGRIRVRFQIVKTGLSWQLNRLELAAYQSDNYICNMKNILKDPRLYFTLWIVLSIILAITLGACKQKPLIEKGDVVEKFVIDSMVQLPPHSTIELDRKYKYFMSDSSEFTSLRKYNIGDTITYVYKKQGK